MSANLHALVKAYVADPRLVTAMPLAAGIENDDDPLTFEPAVDAVLTAAPLDIATRAAIFTALIKRASSTGDPREAYIAATALTAALQLALADQEGVMRLELVAALRSPSEGADAAWALAATRCAGLADAHFAEPSLRAGLRSVLQALTTHPDAATDAAVELAFCKVTDAFAADTVEEMISGLDSAAIDLEAAADAEENRIDAVLMSSCLLALVGFARDAPADTIRGHADRAREAFVDRAAYSWPSAVPLAFRRAQEALWGELVDTLVAAQEARHQSHWGDSAFAARALADAVRTSRTIRLPPAAGGPSDVVAPMIAAGVAERYAHRATLAAALEQHALPDDVATEIAELLGRGDTRPNGESPEDIDDVLGADLNQRVRAALEPELYDEVAEAVKLAAVVRPDRDAQWNEVYERALAGLADAPDLAGPHRQKIQRIVMSTIDFVAMCMTHQTKYQGGALAYLADPTAKEKRLSDHLAGWLTANAGHQVDQEVPNQGYGGRTDVQVIVGLDRFVIECKREKNITANAVEAHLAQTTRYAGVSLRVSGLAILDLSDKATGHVRGLDASVEVHRIDPVDQSGAARHVISLIVPGNRASTPSQVGRATRRTG